MFCINLTVDLNRIILGSIDDSDIIENSLNFIQFNLNKTSTSFTYYYNVSGIYLLSEPVFSKGTITNIRVFGYLGEENLITLVDANRDAAQNGQISRFTLLIRPFLYALVYRPNPSNDILTLLHGPALISHDLSSTSGFLSPDFSLNWSVMEGDRIGVLIPEMCSDSMVESAQALCPSQINLRIPASECLSALYYDPSSDEVEDITELPKNMLEEVLVKLNMMVFINPSSQGIASYTYNFKL